jgi:hypothetical protein
LDQLTTVGREKFFIVNGTTSCGSICLYLSAEAHELRDASKAHTGVNFDDSCYNLSFSLCTLLLTDTFQPARYNLGQIGRFRQVAPRWSVASEGLDHELCVGQVAVRLVTQYSSKSHHAMMTLRQKMFGMNLVESMRANSAT